MKKVECFRLSSVDFGGQGDDPEAVTFIPSGYEGIWIAVSEDPSYNLAVSYASKEEIKLLNILRTKGE